MPRQQRARSESGYYHIMLRGNERKNIFLDDKDKLRFMETVFEKEQGERFYMHAFCLMNNHVHLMLSEGNEDIGTAMKRITVSYVSYFNKKNKRVGHLFQDRFRSEVVEQDSYVLSLVRYIHQNPVKAGMVTRAADYKWSSYNCYLDKDNYFTKMLETDFILGLFSANRERAIEEYKIFMNEATEERFVDLQEEVRVMDEEEAKEYWEKTILSQGLENAEPGQIPFSLIKEFKAKTNLSLRKMAEITNLNKDKLNKILRS
ncbi:MAG TPA: transposase [Syntrophomonadaceae bacterium]|jgi:putative transposase|nr:transposase [Syntrophomonadaceae bacterium]HRX20748.1 transposase [Syntrophomonadaceae bacterium]